jgi:TPR repeat protein
MLQQLLLLLLAITPLASAHVFFGPLAEAALKHAWEEAGSSVEGRRQVVLENFRSENVIVYWVNRDQVHARLEIVRKYTRVDLVKPGDTTTLTTLTNRTYAIRDATSNKLILAYVVSGPDYATPHVLIGQDTSCVSLGEAQAQRNALLRSHPLLLSALEEVRGNTSAALDKLRELARTNKALTTFAWTAVGRVLLTSNAAIQPDEGDVASTSAPTLPIAASRFKQASSYFYRAAMRGDEEAQWMLALLFWSGVMKADDMSDIILVRDMRHESGLAQSIRQSIRTAPNSTADSSSSSGSGDGSGSSSNRGMLWPERIGTTWARCAAVGGSRSARMSLAYRHMQGYGVQQSCTTAKRLYKQLAEHSMAAQAKLQRSFETVRLRASASIRPRSSTTAEQKEYLEQRARGGEAVAQFELAER